ncbi:MAG: sugar phosphate nucleotidyltransferase [Candidatus Gottesmanbacteria bacterium]|nr:sugar phosphate nucleotidyltransferase [Candidatus Gottesmanbacteria bacterium]
MKGVILAGGLATRLRPLTLVTNKHLLPIYNKPMVYYPLEAMVRAGVKEVLLTSAPDHAGHFANLLNAGEEFGLHLYYAVQKDPKGGIAQAIELAEKFADHEPILVILGDNIFNFDLKASIKRFEASGKGAMVFGVHLDTKSRQYGVIEIDKNGMVLSIEEKPEHPKSDIAQIGVYIYDGRVFEYIRKLKPSERGELEVTDLNNLYLKDGRLMCDIIDWWIDAGTSFDELLRANTEVARFVKEGKL